MVRRCRQSLASEHWRTVRAETVVRRGTGAAGAAHTASSVTLLLCLHPPVLEPDLHLSLGESQGRGQLQSARSAEISVVVIFLLQLHQLTCLECCSGSLGGQ